VRKRGRRDRNHSDIVRALRKAGCSVIDDMANLGKGVPDLLAARAGQLALMEVKDPLQPPSKRKLTEDEELFHATFGAPIHVVYYPEDALRVMGLIK
jgi:Holliday junction resolvase